MAEPRFVESAATRAVRNDYVQGVAARWYNPTGDDLRRFESIFDGWLEDLRAKERIEILNEVIALARGGQPSTIPTQWIEEIRDRRSLRSGPVGEPTPEGETR